MKEFERWNKNNPTKYALEECGREDGWKEALEQVLTKIDPYESDAENFRAVFDFIQEELEHNGAKE